MVMIQTWGLFQAVAKDNSFGEGRASLGGQRQEADVKALYLNAKNAAWLRKRM
jgi:hypothetical protein